MGCQIIRDAEFLEELHSTVAHFQEVKDWTVRQDFVLKGYLSINILFL